MLNNYLYSSQHQRFILSPEEYSALSDAKTLKTTKKLAIELRVFFYSLIQTICKNLKVRQEVSCTAMVYFVRFFTRNEYTLIDPFLILSTSVYLACKVEEMPHQVSHIISETTKALNDSSNPIPFKYSNFDISECEALLLAELEFYLIITHPYQPLLKMCKDLNFDRPEIQLSWYMVNDAYFTHLPLLYSPFVIAASAAFVVFYSSDRNESLQFLEILSSFGIDMKDVTDASKELVNSISIRSQYNEENVIEYLRKLITSS